jgi:hypothetical protein
VCSRRLTVRLLLLPSERCADLDREIEGATHRIRALAEQRRNGVAKMEMGSEASMGAVGEAKKIWISHAEEKRLELCAARRTSDDCSAHCARAHDMVCASGTSGNWQHA